MDYDCMREILKNNLKSESDEENENESKFAYLPENVLIKIFKQVSAKDILNCSECSKRLYFVSRDNLLWREKFKSDFKILDKEIKLKPSELTSKEQNQKITQLFEINGPTTVTS